MTYAVVFSASGVRLHLHDHKKSGSRALCGIKCGVYNRPDVKERDGMLFNATHGEWFPENPAEYCKNCLKKTAVNVCKTQAAFDKKI